MYLMDSKVRYSEIDCEGNLNVYGILNYLQDCSTAQSEMLGVGIEHLKENQMVWVLSFWQIDILKYPVLGEEIEVGTIPYEIKGFLGHRNFFIRNKAGEMYVKANSLWTLVDTQTGRPKRVPQYFLDLYKPEERLNMEYLDRKLSVPEGIQYEREPFVVRRHNIDTNSHVNNAQYVSMAMDYIKDTRNIRRLRAEYKKSAILGDVISPIVKTGEEWEYVSLCNEAGESFANILFDKG